MKHVRTHIRERLRDALETGLLKPGYTVFGSRKYARNHTRGEAIVDIRFLNVNVTQVTMSGDRTHIGSLYVRIQRDAAEEKMDDMLDRDEVYVTEIIERVEWNDLLETSPELVQVNFSEDAESGTPIGAIILRYDVEYRIDKTDPTMVSR